MRNFSRPGINYYRQKIVLFLEFAGHLAKDS